MSRYTPIFLLIAFGVVMAVFFQGDRAIQAELQPYQPLEGTLFKGHIDSLDKADIPMPTPVIKLPTVKIFLKDLKWIGLPADTKQFIGVLVPEPDAKGLLVLPTTQHHSKRVRPFSVILSTPLVKESAHEESKPPELSFAYFNAMLETSETSFALADRFTKGGITLQLEQIATWKNLYLVKCSLLNEEEKEFFISSLNVSVNGRQIRSDSYVPFSCPPHETVAGIVTFPIQAATNKQVTMTLIQDGDKYTKLEINNVGYKF